MANVNVTLPGEALEQIMAAYEGQVPPHKPVENRVDPSGEGWIDSHDLHCVIEVVKPLWPMTSLPEWALDEAEKALERFPPSWTEGREAEG